MKKTISLCVFFFAVILAFGEGGLCLDDCFNYQYPRQDLIKTHGWGGVKAFEEQDEDGFIVEKRWPTVNLTLTPEEEKARFGTTGLVLAKKAYKIYHYDGTNMRMFVYATVCHRAGERKLIGWRGETNPAMPEEYLDPDYPEEKKEGEDWSIMIHWVDPSDIRGTGILIKSYNNKDKDHDTWIWFPSLRKTRRLTPSNGDDGVGGTDHTFSTGFLLRIKDEKQQIIGETRYSAYLPVDYYEGLYLLDKYGPATKEYVEYYKKVIAQPRDCWVLRCKSVRGGYGDWYHTRITFIDKELGCEYGYEMFTPKGRLMRTYWFTNRSTSDFNGKPRLAWVNIMEVINLQDRGYTYFVAPQTSFGCPVDESWFSLRELKRSVPTVSIPYMTVLLPQNLAPLKELYPPEIIEARKEFFPERITSFPDATGPVGIDKWR